MIWSDRKWITAVVSKGGESGYPLGNCQTEGRVADSLAFPFGLSDVGIMSYDHGHEGDVHFSKMNPSQGFKGYFGTVFSEPGAGRKREQL